MTKRIVLISAGIGALVVSYYASQLGSRFVPIATQANSSQNNDSVGSNPPLDASSAQKRAPLTPNRTANEFLHPVRGTPLMNHEMRAAGALPPSSKFMAAEQLTPLEARSPEEAAWLDRNGYPSWADYMKFQVYTDEELAVRASKGDLAAQAMLGMKQARRGEFSNGYANLEDAAARGSVFAIVGLAESQARSGDTVTSMALIRLAELRGDYQAIQMLPQLDSMWKSITPWAIGQATSDSFQYFQNLNNLRSRLGLGPFDNQARPGYDLPPPGKNEQVGTYERTAFGGP